MKTIKDLLIEKNTHNLDFDFNERYYLNIKVLLPTPTSYCTIITPDGKYNFNKIIGIEVNVFDTKNNYEDFRLMDAKINTTLGELQILAHNAIKEYEKNFKEDDYLNVFVYKDIDGKDLAFTETFLDEEQAINYADRFVKYYSRVEVIYQDGTKIF